MTNLEVQLTEVMIKLILQYPDGWDRIHAALQSVLRAGFEITQDSPDLNHAETFIAATEWIH